MKQTRITLNLDGLEDMRRSMGNKYRARVGILGAKAAREDGQGINNATLGVIQMFGSITNNIPPRDFLPFPVRQNKQELVKTMSSGMARAAFEAGDYKKVFGILGVKAEELVQRAFETGGFGQWAPLKPRTIAAKGSAAILIDTGQLRRSISSMVVSRGVEA